MENDNIVRKIQKLLALAQSSNEAEANLAMARAQELLAEYNLELAAVKGAYVEGGTNAPEPEKRERTKIPYSAFYKYQQQLWRALAEANFCWYWVADTTEEYGKRTDIGIEVRHRKVKRHMLLGTESNVIVVRMMGEYLEDTMERILPFPNTERLSRSAISWKTGCAERLVQRINLLAAERMEAITKPTESGCTAIALRDVIQAEYEANYDAAYGAGAWAKSRQRQEDAKVAKIKAEEEWEKYLLTESHVEKQLRLKKEAQEAARVAKEQAKWQRRWDNAQRARIRNLDHGAYWDGHAEGNDIGLDGQVGTAKERERLD